MVSTTHMAWWLMPITYWTRVALDTFEALEHQVACTSSAAAGDGLVASPGDSSFGPLALGSGSH